MGYPIAPIKLMSPQAEEMIVALENGEATAEQQKEAARVILDLDWELREPFNWEQRD